MEDLLAQTTETELLEIENGVQHNADEPDYASFTLADFKKLVAKHNDQVDISANFSVFRKIKPFIEELAENEKNEALNKFIADGSNPDDFALKQDEFYQKFEQAFHKSRIAYNDKIKEYQFKKENNLKTKREILDKMRSLIENAPKKNVFESFKLLQQEWKNAGPVPSEHNQELWSSYTALVNRFYDHRHIAFELVDLDRKRNLQVKQLLCEKVEALVNESSIKKALKELEEIHEEFKHIGPVPKEQQEEIWSRLKAASDKIHEKRHIYIEEQKAKHNQNMEAKLLILEKLKTYGEFESQRIDEWVEKTKELEVLQQQWKESGTIDKDKVKEVNKLFWEGLKKFYNNKRLFFKDIEALKKENLKLKTELCEKAEALQTNQDWEQTAAQILALQKQWKEVGHVPLKMKDKIYERFKKACDTFFENRRAAGKAQQEVAKQQVKAKYEFIDTVGKKSNNNESIDNIKKLIAEWEAMPAENNEDYAKAYSKFAETIRVKLQDIKDIDALDKEKIVSRLQTNALNASPDGEKEKQNRERRLRKEIRDLEDNIAQYKNNLEFFARAKNADAIRKDFNTKIEADEHNLKLLQTRLRILTSK
ncbi:MAG: DUF349 domain-containing protein [Bacteroidota bacterium]|nr:DUF349 domain-containing protein [Bacteroidota bacterium]